ncbi:hypothetical protein ABIF97_004223 [Bradyrhizobium japonicum]
MPASTKSVSNEFVVHARGLVDDEATETLAHGMIQRIPALSQQSWCAFLQAHNANSHSSRLPCYAVESAAVSAARLKFGCRQFVGEYRQIEIALQPASGVMTRQSSGRISRRMLSPSFAKY